MNAAPADPTRRARPYRPFGMSGGLLLFLALFLPAVRVCGDPATPAELYPIAPPYLLGLLAAIALAVVAGPALRGWGVVSQVLASLIMVLAGVAVHAGLLEGEGPAIPLVAIWWTGAWLFAETFRRRLPWEARIARAIAVPTFGWAAFLALFLLFDQDAMYGAAIGAVGAVALGAACVAWERDARLAAARVARHQPAPAAIPRARLR